MAGSSKAMGKISTGEESLLKLARIGRRLKDRSDGELLQSEFQESPEKADGPVRQKKHGSKHASRSCATPPSSLTKTDEPSDLFSSEYSSRERDSCASSAESQVVAAFKAIFEAQSFGEVARYDAKNSFVDFLRLFNPKYFESA
ncbi:hypothetical protein Aduo_002990 [Ancylostoma duodenale]